MKLEKSHIKNVKNYLLDTQKALCLNFSKEDLSGNFIRDIWEHASGGGGISCVYENGRIFESLGINFSHVKGEKLPPAATAARPDLAGHPFEAMGISLVCHPLNPYVPTAHFNFRFFAVHKTPSDIVSWFGGGFDMTPYYAFTEDVVHFHQMAHNACAPFGDQLYPQFKQAADDYFYLKHRKEPRGIGGIFFDDFFQQDFDHSFSFFKSVGEHFSQAYLPIVKSRKDTPYGERERDFQLYRRGRYVEFNLVYDRGTHFGLQSGGRTESILMSLPPVVNWRYNWAPEPGSPEAELYNVFLKPKNWLADCKAEYIQ